MNTDGDIRILKQGEKPTDFEVPLEKLPNPNCKDCLGRGYIRYIIGNIRELRPCHCTK